MPDPALTIRDFRLRVPGLGPEEARRLGEAVARELAARPPRPRSPSPSSTNLASLTLRVQAGTGGGVQSLAARIAESLRRSLS